MTKQKVKISNLVEVPGNKQSGYKWQISRDYTVGDFDPRSWPAFEELPGIEKATGNASYKPKNVEGKRWRITCFFVDTSHRHKCLAKMALDGALEGVTGDGGGLVEAYPVMKKNTVEVWFGSVGMSLERGKSRDIARLQSIRGNHTGRFRRARRCSIGDGGGLTETNHSQCTQSVEGR
ncbi:MAG: hypothetical protein LVQ63_07370 [Thermoplasmatales archaeon]|nr:hypothetical protein [Thermoplasmatales archaeon]